ncbi:MAG TPA: nicotinate-nucleotide--dimethylbenzimidazole phosphoribosyltransferase [Kofleriaceae bacterium]|nr:nicotinate-nucleotide--dimethylbenzimidazole phosphoribosyltransferase [Kofleriaceae bacterium]
MSSVLAHVVGSIGRASEAHGEAARRHVATAAAPVLERLAATLGGAQHTPRPRAARRSIIVCAGDHGVGDPGIALGAAHPTVVAAHAIADGSAALAHVARASRAPIVLVDAGAAERAAMPATAIQLGRGATASLVTGPAMTVVDAALGLEAGIALAVSLVDAGLDVVALGALGVGADVASAALLGAALGAPPTGLADPVAEQAGARGAEHAGSGALELLATFGGAETAVLAGLVLGAASMNVPVILDGYATGAAAVIAARFAPAVTGYLVAAHAGTFTQPRILAHLGLTPVFDVGIGHGEGTGAAMVIPLVDQIAALATAG